MPFFSHHGNCVFCIFLFPIVFVCLLCAIFLSIFHPHGVKFYVTDASVSSFNFTDNSTIYYNLALNITARNPNNRIAVDYKRVTAIAYYKDTPFGAVNLSPFTQGHKNTTYLHAVFSGQQGLWLKEKYLGEYYSERSAGAYLINVDLELEIRARYGRLKYSTTPPIISCRMKIPVVNATGDGKQGSSFSFIPTKCKQTRGFFTNRYRN